MRFRLSIVCLLLFCSSLLCPTKGATLFYAMEQGDSIGQARYGTTKTVPETHDDLKENRSDLKNPENIITETVYDEKDGTYSVGNKMGNTFLGVPILMTQQEYAQWSMTKSLQGYYRSKNQEEFTNEGKEKFDFTDMKFDLGPAEKIFGPGGVQIKTQGSAELKMGFTSQQLDNPSLPERNRNTFNFDFDEQINLNIQGSVGDKMSMKMSYNTEAVFSYDTKNIKLSYEGKEDEIIQLLEGGNVSFPTNSSLIKGATSLFGIRADLQFGKLKLQTVVSQKNSSSASVSSKGGAQLTSYEIDIADYDENRHFFLAHYFHDNYDKGMAQLPTIMSGITINRIEVWITNKTSSYSSPRNILAFTDLGEPKKISNSQWIANTAEAIPYNAANNLYSTMVSTYSSLRNIDLANSVFEGMGGFEGGADYEKISNARLLSSSEYTLNASLGYISLKTALKSDEVLAVAFEYTSGGKTYQVGEFSGDQRESSTTLYVKLIKPNSGSPANGCWDLMMKNVYALGATNIKSDNFKLDIYYASDTLGTSVPYLPEQNLKNTPLLRLLGLDRLDATCSKANPNGVFDFLQGYTINASNGRIFFPVVEPFGGYLREKIGDDAVAQNYIYQELYDSTKTVARQLAEKDKFIIMGEYSGSQANVIQTGSTNIPKGSVVVTAGGITLTEGSDYIVNYSNGEVTITNQSIIDAGTAVNVSVESDSDFGMQRKTMLGLNWEYEFSDRFQMGGTIMHLSEKPLTSKVSMGSEPLNNTLWGVNLAWKTESQWLTNMIDKIPLINCTQPSTINLTADFAQLIAGTSSDVQSSASYIDDFESTETAIDISTPSMWSLSGIPSDMEYANLNNDLRTGYNRALINWFNIDPLFTRRSSSLTPSHIKSDLDQLSNHYVREVYERELFPNKESTYGESSTLTVFNVAYYPAERGPYNLDTDLTTEGKLNNPEKRWGGIMRQLTTTDFETSNIEYIEFWMLDPFIYDSLATEGGDLYFNLGEVSEDVLKDGKKFYENGLPGGSNSTGAYNETVWGRVPTGTSLVYAFDNSGSSRSMQDVGLNGLGTEDERSFPAYSDYLTAVQGRVSASAYEQIYNDPAGDNYHYYRGSDYDAEERSILNRYKNYNNTEGNSVTSGDSGESYDTSAKTTPDVEDANQDYTLDEYEKYFQYHVSLRPNDLAVGSNYISDKRSVTSRLRNGNTEVVNWYKFRIPLDEYEKKVGSINDFTSIRFIRMYMSGFKKEVVLRFATLQLVRDEWRTYTQPIYSSSNSSPTVSGSLTLSPVNIEENGDREPVNYVLPPGISRILDPSQPQLRQDNEQALSIQVNDLGSNEARAVYKKISYDIRQYEHIQLFVHAEALEQNTSQLSDGELSVFIRFGSDYKNNYYEYEIPLELTPAGSYDANSSASRKLVWPESNMLDIELSKFTDLKVRRNSLRNRNTGNVSNTQLYYEYDGDNEKNKISIIGNPSLGTIKTVMIGVRNNSHSIKSGIVWVNELRLIGFNNKSGWAAQGAMNVQLSDLGSVNLAGHVETAGFGGLEEGLGNRRVDDYYQYAVTTTFNLGKFFPQKAKVSIPLYYSYTKEWTSPLYSPFDTDLMFDDVLDSYANSNQKDSLRNIAEEMSVSKNFSLSNVKVNIMSKKPMPYDPANLSFSFSRSQTDKSGKTIDYQTSLNWKAALNYTYAPAFKAWEPFKNIKNKSKWMQIFKDFGLNYLPQSISLNTNMSRSYQELQTRDLNNVYGDTKIPVTFSQQFYWDRDFALRWDLTKNLQMNLRTATHAEIEEPYLPVNKSLYPDEYSIWKDSVKQSLRNLGRPLDYQQTFTASYKVPLTKLPILDWTTLDANYNGSYNWKRGSTSTSGLFYGNTVGNKRTVTINGKFNLETLYNKAPFLQETNKRFASSKSNARTNSKGAKNTKNTKKAADTKKQAKAYSTEVKLNMDSAVVVNHNQKSKRPIVSARTKEGKRYDIKYKVIDENSIRVKNKDSVQIKVSVLPGRKAEEQTWYKLAQIPTRFIMMVRNASFTYTNNYAMQLPGFLPNVGDMLGQRSGQGPYAPGLDFAFGLTGDDYLRRAYNRGWLLCNDSISTQASSVAAEDLQVKMTLEPLADLKIDLNASWSRSKTRNIQYMYAGMPETQSGTFTMTTITIGSAFEGGNTDNGYRSKTFDKFVENLETYRASQEAKFAGTKYPEGSTLAGQPFDAANGGVNRYSADVMIPAFLSAYTGSDHGCTFSNMFPSFLSMLPNWNIKYAGLSKLPFFQKYFKSFNLNHGYKSVYAVGSYSTYSSYMEYMNGYGFIQDVTSGNPIPNSMYDVSTVSINESFSPLIGVDMTFLNGISAKVEYRKTRVLNLSMTAVQLVETSSQDIVMGAGYKFTNLKLFGVATGKKATSNDLNLRTEFTFKNQSALCRSIDELTTQATSGNKSLSFSFSADYTYSKMLTISAYFDRKKTIPLISASSYPTTTTDFGLSMKFSLTR